MFEDKRYNNDNLNKNRFFMPEDNTGLKAGNDNLSFDENRRYTPPPIMKPAEPKKNKKKFKGLAITLVVLIIIGLLTITGIGIANLMISPYKIYTKAFNEGYQLLETYLKESDSKKLNYNVEEDSIVSSGSFNIHTDIKGLDSFNDYNYDYKFNLNIKDEALDGNLIFKKGNSSFINLKSYLRDNKIYILEKNIYNNLVEVGSKSGDLSSLSLNYNYEDVLNIMNSVKDTFIRELNEENLTKEKTKININGNNLKVTNNILTLNKDEIEVLIKNIIEDLMENNEALKSISNLTNISRKDLVSMLKELKNDENLTVDIKELKINIYTEGLANNFKGIKFIIDKNEIFSYLNHDTNSVLNIRGESLDLKLNFDNNKSNVILNYEDIPIFNAEFTKDNDKTNVEFEINIEVNDETLEVSGTAQYELKRIGDKRQTFKLSGNINTNINKEKSSFKIELNNMTQVGGKVQDIDVSNAINVEDFTLKDIKIIDSSMERVLYKSPLLNLYKDMFGDKVQNIYDCAKSYGCICNDVECRCKYLDDYKVEKDIICPI